MTMTLSMDDITPRPERLNFNDELHDLVKDIAENGLKNPITVEKIKNRYKIIDGNKRYKAHFILKKFQIEARIIK